MLSLFSNLVGCVCTPKSRLGDSPHPTPRLLNPLWSSGRNFRNSTSRKPCTQGDGQIKQMEEKCNQQQLKCGAYLQHSKVELLPGTLTSHAAVTFSPCISTSDSASCSSPWKDSWRWTSCLVPCTPLGNPDGSPGSWFLPSPALWPFEEWLS